MRLPHWSILRQRGASEKIKNFGGDDAVRVLRQGHQQKNIFAFFELPPKFLGGRTFFVPKIIPKIMLNSKIGN